MNRLVVLITTVAALVTATTVVWTEVRKEREFERLISVGDAALDANRTSDAIEAFSGALAFKPDSMLAHLQRAETYRRRGDRDLTAALRDARAANTLDPTAPQPIELLGDIHTAMAHYEQAVNYYQRYLQLDDRSTRALYKLSLAYVRQGRPRDAIDPLRRALSLDERFAEAHYLLGFALRNAGETGEAVRVLKSAVALNGALIAAREELADLYLAGGRIRDGIEQLEAIAALEPSVAGRLVDVALALARSGQREAALASLRRAGDRHADSPVILAAVGRVWLETAREEDDALALEKAIKTLQRLARRPDATSEVLALLGEAMLMTGNVADAERMLQQAVTRQPVAAVAYRHLAEAARRRGHTAIARDAKARYQRLVPDP
jgi:tetratricopeptide (TPR) repeat protein